MDDSDVILTLSARVSGPTFHSAFGSCPRQSHQTVALRGRTWTHSPVLPASLPISQVVLDLIHSRPCFLLLFRVVCTRLSNSHATGGSRCAGVVQIQIQCHTNQRSLSFRLAPHIRLVFGRFTVEVSSVYGRDPNGAAAMRAGQVLIVTAIQPQTPIGCKGGTWMGCVVTAAGATTFAKAPLPSGAATSSAER